MQISVHLHDRLKTTLLHEIAHKIFYKLGWNELQERGWYEELEEIELDIAALNRKNWKNCDEAMARYLEEVADLYLREQHFEEYLVRTVENYL